MIGIVFVAAALGLSNFAASVAIGLTGVDAKLRWRIAIVFGGFEGAMPLAGLLVGHHLAATLGSASTTVGGALLVATGSYTIWQARHSKGETPAVGTRLGPLVVTAAALSIDNLVIGFALGTHKVALVPAAVLIAAVSVTMSLVGLELGARLSKTAERWSGELGGAVLILVGIAIAAGWL